MIRKDYTLSDEEIPLASFCDEFGIDAATFDIHKLKISVDLDYTGCYYQGDRPEVCVVIEYDK